MRMLQLVSLLLLTLSLSGCDTIFAIFEAGLWVGVIGVLIVVAIIAFVVSKMRGRG